MQTYRVYLQGLPRTITAKSSTPIANFRIALNLFSTIRNTSWINVIIRVSLVKSFNIKVERICSCCLDICRCVRAFLLVGYQLVNIFEIYKVQKMDS